MVYEGKRECVWIASMSAPISLVSLFLRVVPHTHGEHQCLNIELFFRVGDLGDNLGGGVCVNVAKHMTCYIGCHFDYK
jgi:hypothetical protein